jgi:hypothetical protein
MSSKEDLPLVSFASGTLISLRESTQKDHLFRLHEVSGLQAIEVDAARNHSILDVSALLDKSLLSNFVITFLYVK